MKLGWEQFEQQRLQNELVRSEENLFRGWAALLQARGEQAEQQEAIQFTDRTIEGNRISFRTVKPLDASAVEQFWEVPISPEHFLRGIVDGVENDIVTLYVDGKVPNTLPKTGILRLDTRSTRAALKRQKDALDSVQFENCVRSELKFSILRPEECTSDEIIPIQHWWFEDLDPDKREAVQRAIAAKNFFVVHGPPGTGKTTFITELILQFKKSHPAGRVLLTSQTHIGVDNAIERLVEVPRGLEVIRVGYQEKKVSESVHRFLLQNRIQEWSRQVQQKAESFIEQWSERNGINLREVKLGVGLGQLINVLRRKEEDQTALLGLKTTLTPPETTAQADEERMDVDAEMAEQHRLQAEEAHEQIELLQERLQKVRAEERRLREESRTLRKGWESGRRRVAPGLGCISGRSTRTV